MPGIAGIFGTTPPAARSIERMVRCMLHEPSYKFGYQLEARLNAALGWVCHQGSYSDCMPVWNERHDICLVFWGEHFADISEAHYLRAADHNVTCLTAACLVQLYEEEGMRFFEKLNGTFCGVIVDLRENKAILFNDRYGLSRVYYHEASEGFFFSSEAKSLLEVLPQLRQLDPCSFGEFFSCGCALQNRTLFKEVSLLPPGSAWIFRPGHPVKKQAYFRKQEWENLPQLPPEEYYQLLKETFTRILPRYFNSKQAVALSLTGGLDSRMIIAAAPHTPNSLPCYTFGGMYRENEDVKGAREVARLCQQPHRIIRVDERFFPQYMSQAMRCVYITDGAMDVSGAVGLVVNRQGREIAPVRMTGNYGSEILRRNVAFKPMPLDLSIFNDDFLPSVQAATETYNKERQGNLVSFIAFKQVPWHHFCRFAEENSQLTIRSPYLDNDLVRLAYQAPPGLLFNKQLALRYCSDMKAVLKGAPTDRGMLDRPAIVPEKVYQLWKERWPKAEYYFDYGMPQWMAKADRVLAPLHLERLFLGQQKYYHFRIWYRDALGKHLREVLLDPKTLGRPYLNSQRVEQIVNSHTKGTGNYTLELHKLMTSEFIERQLIA